jgi:hypothetical protein
VRAVLITGAIALMIAINTAGWVRTREAIHLWWEQTKDAAMSGTKPTLKNDDDEPEDERR